MKEPATTLSPEDLTRAEKVLYFTTEAGYEEFVSRLSKPGADILASTTPNHQHLNHMAIGLAGELGELAERVLGYDLEGPLSASEEESLIEEGGDFVFYLQGLLVGIGSAFTSAAFTGQSLISHASLRGLNHDERFLLLAKFTGDVLDGIKREVIYGKELERVKVIRAIHACKITLYSLLDGATNGDPRRVLKAHNVEKLMERYEKVAYSDEAALARADKNPGE
jgi:hypothetical protein